MNKSLKDTYEDANAFTTSSALKDAVCSYLLVEPDVKFIFINALTNYKDSMEDICKYKDYINKYNQNYQIINDYIVIKTNMREAVKNYVKSELLWFISPVYETGTPYTPQRFFDRYVTQNDYSKECLDIIDLLTDKITNLSIKFPTYEQAKEMHTFWGFTYLIDCGKKWSAFISDIINKKLKTGDDATKYFDTKINEFVKFMKDMSLPMLIDFVDGKLTVTDLYKKNTLSILPYVVSFLRTAFSRVSLKTISLFSCFN